MCVLVTRTGFVLAVGEGAELVSEGCQLPSNLVKAEQIATPHPTPIHELLSLILKFIF